MKTRNSTASDAKRRRNGAGEVSDIHINYSSGPSLSDLPDGIMVNILLKLSIKRIFVCKCVCKAWYDLISDPHFAKLHFDQAQVYPLIRTSRSTSLSRMLHLVQPDDFDICFDSSPIKFKLDCKLKLPLRNIEMILDQQGAESRNHKKLNTRNTKYNIVNSCNGLLCLSDPYYNEPYLSKPSNKPVIVCNPVTGEFINLPVDSTVSSRGFCCGFGFSPVSNQYKVIRISSGRIGHDIALMGVEVHVLGTETWRVLPFIPQTRKYLEFPTYLNGCVYWFCPISPYSVISFDIEKERFESFSLPMQLDSVNLETHKMGVLGGELFILDSYQGVRVWAMKDNGANKAWSQIFSFQMDDDIFFASYKPIKYLNNGALLMFDYAKRALMYKDPRKTGFRYLKVHGFKSSLEVIAHIPSFVPLKHALSGHNVKVLNVKSSRYAELKVNGEDQVISIVEKVRKIKCDF